MLEKCPRPDIIETVIGVCVIAFLNGIENDLGCPFVEESLGLVQ